MSKTLSSIIHTAARSLFEKGEVRSIADYFSSDYVIHLTKKDHVGGHEVVHAGVKEILKAFPSPQVEIEILNETSNQVVWLRTFNSVQKGAYKGFPACNRQIIWREMVVSRFENDLIVEEWVSSDLAEQLLLSRSPNKHNLNR